MVKPHKHAELIKAWADGAEIQYLDKVGNTEHWKDCHNELEPPCFYEDVEYRIKPEPKPDVEKYLVKNDKDSFVWDELIHTPKTLKPFIKLTFDGETGELKSAEVLK